MLPERRPPLIGNEALEHRDASGARPARACAYAPRERGVHEIRKAQVGPWTVEATDGLRSALVVAELQVHGGEGPDSMQEAVGMGECFCALQGPCSPVLGHPGSSRPPRGRRLATLLRRGKRAGRAGPLIEEIATHEIDASLEGRYCAEEVAGPVLGLAEEEQAKAGERGCAHRLCDAQCPMRVVERRLGASRDD